MMLENETGEDIISTETEDENDSEISEKREKRKRIENLRTLPNIPDDMPKFLLRVSSTYFRGSTDIRGFFKKRPKYSQVNDYKPPPPPTLEEIQKIAEEKYKKSQLAEELKKYTKELDNSIVMEASADQEKQTPRMTENFSFHRKNESRISISDSLNNRSMSVNTCLVCFDKPPDTVFFDCGHGGLCYDCSLDVWKKTGECYLCRSAIVRIIQLELEKGLHRINRIKKVCEIQNKSYREENSESMDQSVLRYIEDSIKEEADLE